MNFNLADNNEDVDEELLDEQEVQENEQAQQQQAQSRKAALPPTLESLFELPESTSKDKSLKEVLSLLDGEYAPVIPDAITDYYLAKNGLNCSNVQIKRLLALATQKFISDIATDAYEYSRIRSSNAVYNSSNPQVRARALVNNQQQMSGSNAAGSSGGGSSSGGGAATKNEKLVLTTDDLSNALLEYGLNINRPDFYR